MNTGPWKLAPLVCVLALLAGTPTAQGTFLETYQTQLTELHQYLTVEIGERFGRNSGLTANLTRLDLLPVLAEGTVAIREANDNLREQIENLRLEDDSTEDSECWDAVDALVYLYTQFAQWDLQDCAYGGYSQWLRDDGRERFYPVAHELHRASSEVISAIVNVLSEDNAVSNAPEVEGRLDAMLDHFNEITIEGVQDLGEELARHNDRRDAILQYMGECIDRTIEASREDVEYTVRYAEFFCLDE